jgi:hypothetical protein
VRFDRRENNASPKSIAILGSIFCDFFTNKVGN